MPDSIIVKGARAHNLKNVSITLPKNKLIVITGLSGSGKSSLAFDTIYAEGQRRYAESLSSYARQFMEVRDKPDVDSIDGLSPTIAIDQKMSVQNPRSTVGTVTEVYDYLRLLFARAGTQHCPDCHVPVQMHTTGEIIDATRKLIQKNTETLILSPIIRRQTIDPKTALEQVERSGSEMVRVNGTVIGIHDFSSYRFKTNERYTIELLVGKIIEKNNQNYSKMVEDALDMSNGFVVIASAKEEQLFSTVGLCANCGRVLPTLDIRSFSFNSPYGACPRCSGLGITQEVDPKLVIPNPRLTLAEGAIQPWTRIVGNGQRYQALLKEVAATHHFSIDIPVVDLPEKVMHIILQGTDGETYDVQGKQITYPGVIPDLMSKHLETDSDYVRKEIEQYMHETICSSCNGKRLRPESLAVTYANRTISEVAQLGVEEMAIELDKLLSKNNTKIAAPIIKEMLRRLKNLVEVGLGYLSVDRAMNTLSGGEAARVRLATQLSTGLTGVIYILDEPSVGLHPRDNAKLIASLKYLRDLGNTVIVVEHDEAMMEAADWLVDVGPGAGVQGGTILAAGTFAQIKKTKTSLTGQYLNGEVTIAIPSDAKKKKRGSGKSIEVIGAKAFNLKNVDVAIPLGQLVCVTGVSGSGKSTLIIDILSKALAKHFYRAKDEPGEHKTIKGIGHIDKVISIDQSPIGRTPRSNPATYTGIFTLIRDLFAGLPEAKMRHYDAGKFSFNVKGGGRCEVCAGEGYLRIPMQFLADVFVECNECNGSRYNQEALEVHYHNKTIAEVLRMTVDEAFTFFNTIPALSEKLLVLRDVGLGYVQLGQPATTLSGGEAQRIKLATELSRASTGKTLYILDEPTTGLHFEDIKRLLVVLNKLVDKGNTVLIIEHNTDVIRSSDWVIDLGPEGGAKGGKILVAGPPDKVAKTKGSATGYYLAQ